MPPLRWDADEMTMRAWRKDKGVAADRIGALCGPLEPIAPTIVACQWFARCTNDAEFVVMHPILNSVPCCTRCADHMDLPVEKRLRLA